MTHIIINKVPSLDVSIMGPKHEINWYYSTRNSPKLNQTVILNNMSVIYPLSRIFFNTPRILWSFLKFY